MEVERTFEMKVWRAWRYLWLREVCLRMLWRCMLWLRKEMRRDVDDGDGGNKVLGGKVKRRM